MKRALAQLGHEANDKLKALTPPAARRRLVMSRLRARRVTARWRVLPDLLVIGAQRSGTSSLYKYLGRHPDVVPSLRKETGFFSSDYDEGDLWYRSHFPLELRRTLRKARGGDFVSFEATPDYLLDPRAAARAHSLVPDAMLVVMLREPVSRAYSHYRHNVRLGLETLSFSDAIAQEDDRIGDDLEATRSGDLAHRAVRLRRFSYFTRGLYADQLAVWLKHYSPSQLLVVTSEEFFDRTGDVLDRIVAFAGLRRWRPRQFQNHSYLKPPAVVPSIDAETGALLAQRFERPNASLRELLGLDLGWVTNDG